MASPIKRVTRARAAAKTTDTNKDASARKVAASKITKTSAGRKTKATEETLIEGAEQPKKASTRTAKSTSLASAPRRRIKVTPLDARTAVDEPEPEPAQETTKAQKTTARSRKTPCAKEDTEDGTTKVEPELQSKTRKRSTKATEKAPAKEDHAPKTRGRPKRAAAAQEEDNVETPKGQSVPTTRQTRARAASSAEPANDALTAVPKPKTATRKKVTFQDLPEDDKENQPVPTRKTAAKKESIPATGMRAKPIRKPTAAATKKAAATSKSKVTKAPPRALTPKKVSQINRQTTPTSSDAEDELSGAKTPVRDLSLSPKRNPQLGARLSPVKRLDFTQTIKSPDRTADSAGLFSPARRPASPTKEAAAMSPLKESARRVEVPPVFPSTAQQSINVAAAFAPSSMSQSVLLQSPKRVQLDSNAFSQSAIKPNTSPSKQSLLQSPARRLFSPAKRKTPEVREKHLSAATPEEIAVSSHFRASVSPQRSVRVHRMSDEELAEEMKDSIDFDQSVLSVRSPLKVANAVYPQAILEHEDVPMVEEDFEGTAAEAGNEAGLNDKTNTQDFVPDEVEMRNSTEREAPSETSNDQETSLSESAAEEESTIIVSPERPSLGGPRLSEVLFRSTRFKEEDESSEDELAADMTPNQAPRLFRSSLTGAGKQSRLSTVAPSSLSRDVGFTPLAAQMSGWLAASPEKKSVKKQQHRGIFSPVAAQHVDGEVQISRQSTPQQHRSPLAASQTGSARSVKSRRSLASSVGPTPEKTSFFEEQMIAQDADEHMEDTHDAESLDSGSILYDTHKKGVGETDTSVLDEQHSSFGEQQVQAVLETEDDTIILEQGNGELTTDLINFTNASDTAMVDFAQLAEEAEHLAPSESDVQLSSSDNSVYGDENAVPEQSAARSVAEGPAAVEASEGRPFNEGHNLPEQQAEAQEQDKFSALTPQQDFEIQQAATSLNGSPPAPAHYESIEMVTPVRPDLSMPRFVNTVVSKVPLRPEGNISPIKVQKKRSRSLSTAGRNESPPKRLQLTPDDKLAARSTSDNVLSPTRSIRSAAPSPAHTTPGQTSFAVEDFGDSTLDGIELPEDEMDFDVGPPNATATPATIKGVKNARSAAPTPSRTPLKSVGGGVLHGAIVYVEVHTTEGADASGVYVDLLTQMGARCVKDWRWNPRASINGAEDPVNPTKAGITHVVYKDGGKRTLEKVRDAKGEIWCVGVRWVLE